MSVHLRESHLFETLQTGFSGERPSPAGGCEGTSCVGVTDSTLGDERAQQCFQLVELHQLTSVPIMAAGIHGGSKGRGVLSGEGF